jgi:hypothetical protein
MPDTENRRSLSINASQPRSCCRYAVFLGSAGEIRGALRLSGDQPQGPHRQPYALSPRARSARKGPGAFRQTGSPREFLMSREPPSPTPKPIWTAARSRPASRAGSPSRPRVKTRNARPNSSATSRWRCGPRWEVMGFVCPRAHAGQRTRAFPLCRAHGGQGASDRARLRAC